MASTAELQRAPARAPAGARRPTRPATCIRTLDASRAPAPFEPGPGWGVVALLLAALAGLPSVSMAAQETVIRGVVKDPDGQPLAGVQVYVQGSQTLEATDSQGRFALRTGETGARVLIAFAPGFWSSETVLHLDGAAHDVELVMERANLAETVEVAAPAPEDAAPSVQAFEPLDVVRLPGAQADVMLFVQNLAGVNQLNDEAGLFVRGGDSNEVLTMLDEAVLYHPYRYETVTGGIRGTVAPFLTREIAFSSGGFPARYGNALSGVLEMRGLERPAAPAGGASLALTGVSGNASLPVRAGGGVRVSGNWSETGPMFRLNRSPRAFTRHPDSRDVNASGHYESPSLGTFKVFGMSLRENVGIEVEREAYRGFLESANANDLAYLRWDRISAGGWRAGATLALTEYRSDTHAGALDLEQADRRHSWRADVSRITTAGTVRFGTDGSRSRHAFAGSAPHASVDFGGVRGVSSFDVAFDDWHAGVYAEFEGGPGVLVPNVGVRVDRFHRTGATTIDPRLSLLVRTGERQRLRVAWGIYHQAPGAGSYYGSYRGWAALRPMRAYHWVGGYEYTSADDSVRLRAEAYFKRYSDLPLEYPAAVFSSTGYGAAHGADVYARKRWGPLSVEAVYGWLHTRRRWTSTVEASRGFDVPDTGTWTPYFAIPHGFRATLAAELTATVTASASWRTASGRPFTPVVDARAGERGYVPVYGPINSDRAPRYERLDLGCDIVTPFGPIVFAAVTNVLGRHNVLDYAYSPDYSERRPVAVALPRAVYFGMTLPLR